MFKIIMYDVDTFPYRTYSIYDYVFKNEALSLLDCYSNFNGSNKKLFYILEL